MHTSIAIGADGFPAFTYFPLGLGGLRVVKCVNTACTFPDGGMVDNEVTAGTDSSIAIGADGFPVISYRGSTGLKLAKCVNAACTGVSTTTTVDPVSIFGTSLAIGADGLPVISYYDATAGALKVAKCNRPSCAP